MSSDGVRDARVELIRLALLGAAQEREKYNGRWRVDVAEVWRDGRIVYEFCRTGCSLARKITRRTQLMRPKDLDDFLVNLIKQEAMMAIADADHV